MRMLPIVTLIALNLGFTVSGAIYIETVFSYDGLGKLFQDALTKQDYPSAAGGLPAAGGQRHPRQYAGGYSLHVSRSARESQLAWGRNSFPAQPANSGGLSAATNLDYSAASWFCRL